MSTINRIIIVVALLALMALGTAVCILPHIILSNVGQWLVELGRYFNSVQPVVRLILGLLLALFMNVVILFLIFLEVRPGHRRFIRVQQVTGGMATISTDSITQQVTYKLDPIPGVLKVSPKINAKGDKVRAVVDVEVAAGSDVPDLATELMTAVKTVLADSLGLQVYGQPEVRLKVAPSPTPVVKKPQPVKEKPAPETPPPLPAAPPAEVPPSQEWAGPPPLPVEEER
ncbi:MAG: alkaline shock response membrane anchor protein AmaP [Anaerolineae bacterium]